jgi:hypothetical protein
VIDRKDALRILRTGNTGKSAGPTGISWTLIHDCCHADDEILDHVTALVEDIVNARVTDPLARALLCAAFLLPIDDGKKRRPIVNIDTFLKIAMEFVGADIAEIVSPTFTPIQLCNAKGGSERAIHELAAGIDAAKAAGDHPVVIKTDAKNAFNALWRQIMLGAFYRNPGTAKYWPFLVWWLTFAPLLLMCDADGTVIATIFSDNGAMQGVYLASLAYALGVQPIYDAVASAFPTLVCRAIVDDFTIAGDALTALSAFEMLRERLGLVGVSLALEKCHVLWLSPAAIPQEVLEKAAALGIRIVRCADPPGDHDPDPTLLRILGTSCYASTHLCQQWLTIVFTRYLCDLSHLLRRRLPLKLRYHLLRMCALRRPTFVMRTHAPSLVSPFIKVWDAATSHVMAQFIQDRGVTSSLPDSARSILALPSSGAGGLGIVRLLDLVAPAYLGAASQASASVFATLRDRAPALLDVPPGTDSCFARIAAAFVLLQNALPALADIQDVPHNARQLLQKEPVAKLQAIYSSHILKASIDTARLALDDEQKALLADISQPSGLATRILHAFPRGKKQWLSNTAFRTFLRMVVGLAPSQLTRERALCPLCDAPLTQDRNHALVCRRVTGGAKAALQHDAVVNCIAAVGQIIGGATDLNGRDLNGDRDQPVPVAPLADTDDGDEDLMHATPMPIVRARTVLDLFLTLSNAYGIDVSIIAPMCTSHRTVTNPIAILERFKELKHRQHQRRHLDLRLVGFGCSVLGSIGGRARAFIGELSNAWCEQYNNSVSASVVYYEIVDRVQKAILEGNVHQIRAYAAATSEVVPGIRVRPRNVPACSRQSAAAAILRTGPTRSVT